MIIFRLLMFGAALMSCPIELAAQDQTTTSPSDLTQTRTTGTVVSSSKSTLIVKTESNQHQLFVLDTETVKPKLIEEGAVVTVISVATNEPGVRVARQILVSAPTTDRSPEPAKPADPADPSSPAQPPANEDVPIPAAVRSLQSDIEREARRFGLGFRTGIGMDPEVLLLGVHARMGPIFNRNITFRPNTEFGFGEVTKLFTVNFDTAYRLPLTPFWSKWGVYAGGGPALGFTHQNFDSAEAGVDFGDLDFAAGFNLFTGIESRNGFFIETKTTLWAEPSPSFRLLFGWTF
jgi:hypothetical protein